MIYGMNYVWQNEADHGEHKDFHYVFTAFEKSDYKMLREPEIRLCRI